MNDRKIKDTVGRRLLVRSAPFSGFFWTPLLILARVSTALDAFSTFSTTKLMWTALFSVGEEIPQSPSEKLEMALISRWEGLCVAPTAGGVGGFSRNQLVYLTRLVKELIDCKNMIIYVSRALVNLIISYYLNRFSVELIYFWIHSPELSLGIFLTYFHRIADNYIIV